MRCSTCSFCRGSPPHAWGRPPRCGWRDDRPRFTPTCVGTAFYHAIGTFFNSVHPHMRGDGYVLFVQHLSFNGSPPHAWGRRFAASIPIRSRRFTPTCVGTACHYHQCLAWPAVHPHMRGDGKWNHGTRCQRFGSPPHAWGRRKAACRHKPGWRFTPTCVGTANRSCAPAYISTVHPHMRGDGRGYSISASIYDGSPPHAWGRLDNPPYRLTSLRFTPTCVGTA